MPWPGRVLFSDVPEILQPCGKIKKPLMICIPFTGYPVKKVHIVTDFSLIFLPGKQLP